MKQKPNVVPTTEKKVVSYHDLFELLKTCTKESDTYNDQGDNEIYVTLSKDMVFDEIVLPNDVLRDSSLVTLFKDLVPLMPKYYVAEFFKDLNDLSFDGANLLSLSLHSHSAKMPEDSQSARIIVNTIVEQDIVNQHYDDPDAFRDAIMSFDDAECYPIFHDLVTLCYARQQMLVRGDTKFTSICSRVIRPKGQSTTSIPRLNTHLAFVRYMYDGVKNPSGNLFSLTAATITQVNFDALHEKRLTENAYMDIVYKCQMLSTDLYGEVSTTTQCSFFHSREDFENWVKYHKNILAEILEVMDEVGTQGNRFVDFTSKIKDRGIHITWGLFMRLFMDSTNQDIALLTPDKQFDYLLKLNGSAQQYVRKLLHV